MRPSDGILTIGTEAMGVVDFLVLMELVVVVVVDDADGDDDADDDGQVVTIDPPVGDVADVVELVGATTGVVLPAVVVWLVDAMMLMVDEDTMPGEMLDVETTFGGCACPLPPHEPH